MSSRDARAEGRQRRPATHAKISFTRPGRIRNCATLSTQSRRSRPIHGFKNSSAGFTSSSQARPSEPGETGPEAASPTADHWVPRFCGFLVPIAQNTERARPKRQVAGESPAGDTSFCGCGSTAECGRAKAETTVRFRSPAPFPLGV